MFPVAWYVCGTFSHIKEILMIFIIKYHYGHQIYEVEMIASCSTRGVVGSDRSKSEGKILSRRMEVNGRIILKCVSSERV